METLKQALNRAKSEVKLTPGEWASSRLALEWKIGQGEQSVRIPEDYRHQARWQGSPLWRGLALVLPLIVIFIAARQVAAPKPEMAPAGVTETVLPLTVPAPPVSPPAPVRLKRLPAPELPVAPVVPQVPLMMPSAGGPVSAPASETNLLRATSTATTSVEELPEDSYNN